MILAGPEGLFVNIGTTKVDGTLLVRNGENVSTLAGTSWSQQPLDLANVQWALAATNDDSCALKLSTAQLKPFAVPQTSAPGEIPQATNGSLFTERGVYRPGETAHFKFVSRTYRNDHIVSPDGSKVQVEISSPRQDIIFSKQLTMNEFGSCWDSVIIEKYFPVGTYTIQAKPVPATNKTPAFSRTFMVQEFKAQRHYVSLSVRPEERAAQDFVAVKVRESYLSVDVRGQYYAGGPVKNGRVRWRAGTCSDHSYQKRV